MFIYVLGFIVVVIVYGGLMVECLGFRNIRELIINDCRELVGGSFSFRVFFFE